MLLIEYVPDVGHCHVIVVPLKPWILLCLASCQPCVSMLHTRTGLCKAPSVLDQGFCKAIMRLLRIPV